MRTQVAQTHVAREGCNVIYVPINGLPQDGGVGGGQPTGIRLRKVHVGGDFDIHNGGKFDSTAIFKSGEDLGMSEWSAILENTQKSFERVSRVQGWMEYRVAFFKAKMLFFMPISALSLKF